MRNDFDASTIVCLTLAKWETVSGQFGGYLSTAGTAIGTLERLLGVGGRVKIIGTSRFSERRSAERLLTLSECIFVRYSTGPFD
jgi:hypothetical protein